MKLVIVDDDSLLCSALSRCLVRLNHSARMAASTDAALALVAAESPAAVLTDLDLGTGGDGVDLIRRLRASGSRVPVVMMTGSDPAAARARLRAAGLDEVPVLEKPFEFDALLRKLADVLPPTFFPPSVTAPPRERATPATKSSFVGNVLASIGGRVI
jgi:DNA-binding response OmpR family regulator